MATKTISIDIEAYDRLKRAKKENESFSQAIKRMIQAPVDVEAKIRAARRLSPEALNAIEEQVSSRRTRPQRSRH